MLNDSSNFISDPYLTKGLFKQTEQEAYRIILRIQTKQFTIIHVKGHQDDENTSEELDTPAKLNIEVDTIATTKATTPFTSTQDIYLITSKEKYDCNSSAKKHDYF